MRHVGEEARFGPIGFVGSIARRRELGFVLFQFCDVRKDRYNTAASGFSFIDLDPAAVTAVLDVCFADSVVARESFLNPGVAPSLGVLDQTAFDGCSYNRFKARARHYYVGMGCKQLSITAIA